MLNAKKTPVSILTELMVKKGQAPNWELIHDGGGTHLNLFIWRVTCDGRCAQGEGRNKRDAKHEAATKMLELIGQSSHLLQLQDTPEQSPVRTPLPMDLPTCPKSPANIPFRNTVGELKDLCGMHHLDPPEYKETGDIGPPHAKIFTVRCSVSTFIENGTATTKKLAKHEAARQMIDRIQSNLDSITPITENHIKIFNDDEEASEQKALNTYASVSKLHNDQSKLKVNLGLKIKDYPQSLKDYIHFNLITEESKAQFFKDFDELSDLVEKGNKNYEDAILADIIEKFQNFLKSIDVKGYEVQLNGKKETDHIVGIRINTAPDICETGIGTNEKDSFLIALGNVLNTMKLLLK